jgi:hypothetical protein
MDHVIDSFVTQEENVYVVALWRMFMLWHCGDNKLMNGFSYSRYASSYKQMEKKKKLQSINHICGEDVFFLHAKY